MNVPWRRQTDRGVLQPSWSKASQTSLSGTAGLLWKHLGPRFSATTTARVTTWLLSLDWHSSVTPVTAIHHLKRASNIRWREELFFANSSFRFPLYKFFGVSKPTRACLSSRWNRADVSLCKTFCFIEELFPGYLNAMREDIVTLIRLAISRLSIPFS